MAEKALEPPEIKESDKKIVDRVKKNYEAGLRYKQAQGYIEEWAEYARFWDGDQWPAATDETENFPRPVTNHFAEIIEMKTAGLTYEKPEMYFEPLPGSRAVSLKIPIDPTRPEEGEEPKQEYITPSELLVNVTNHVAEVVDYEQILENVTRTAGTMGTGLKYHYWDNTIVGGGDGAAYVGDIQTMEIDPADFFPGDPSEQDMQKQPHVIILERRPLKMVKEEYRQFSEMADYLDADSQTSRNQVYDQQKQEHQETNYVDLYHCWEKIWYEKEITVTEGDEENEAVVDKVNDFRIDYYVTSKEYVLRYEKDHYQSKLYPFSGFSWYPKRKSFFGKSESKDLINNQKELNRLQGIGLLGAYKTGLPNVLIKEDFVKLEDAPVGPGGNVIKDTTPLGQGWGISYLSPPAIAPYIPLLKDAMAQGMKDTSGVHEAWSGKAPSAHLNASAIMALQEAAGVRIRGIQRRLYGSIRDDGRIWLGLIKQYYDEDRLFRVFGKNNVEGTAWFKKQDFADLEFEVKVSVSTASPYSKTVIASTLEGMLERQVIDPDLYLRMLPPEVFPKVAELLELLKDRTREQQENIIQQQVALIDHMVAETVSQAAAQGVPITPEAQQQMTQMIQEQAEEIGV